MSLDIQEGEFVALIGPSGSGKSTLMNTLGCLDRPTGGSYRLAEEEVAGMSPDQLAQVRNGRIGFIFQNFNLLARTTALENVEAALLYNRGCPRRERKKRASAMLARVGLANRLDHRPNQLSGGQQQRVAIAGAHQPPGHPALRRADRQPGHAHQPRDHGLLPRAERERGADRHPGDARPGSRPAVAAGLVLIDGEVVLDTTDFDKAAEALHRLREG